MKKKGGNIQGVALSKGTKENSPANPTRYAGYMSGKKAANYAGQSRSKAAASLRKGY